MEVFFAIGSTMLLQLGLCFFCFLKKSDKLSGKNSPSSKISIFF